MRLGSLVDSAYHDDTEIVSSLLLIEYLGIPRYYRLANTLIKVKQRIDYKGNNAKEFFQGFPWIAVNRSSFIEV